MPLNKETKPNNFIIIRYIEPYKSLKKKEKEKKTNFGIK